MKVQNRLFIFFARLFLYSCILWSAGNGNQSFANPAHIESDKTNNEQYAVFSLKDSSRIVGTLSLSSLYVQTDYDLLDVSLENIAAITINHDKQTATIQLRNNDKLTGSLKITIFSLNTIFGPVLLNTELIKKIELFNGKIFFFDDFQDLSKWSPSGGSWTVENDELRQKNKDGVYWCWAGDTAWTDYEAEARVCLLSGKDEVSLGVRASPAGNTYFFCLAGGANRLTLAKILNGVETPNIEWKPWTAQANRWYTMRVKVEKQRIRCFLNKKLIFDYVAPDMPSQGRIGLRTYYTQAHFDNVQVKPILPFQN
jgi:hypothetical protein